MWLERAGGTNHSRCSSNAIASQTGKQATLHLAAGVFGSVYSDVRPSLDWVTNFLVVGNCLFGPRSLEDVPHFALWFAA